MHIFSFQSTPSVWRETAESDNTDCSPNFNPLPPCGGRRTHISTVSGAIPISIHSLRVEGDACSQQSDIHRQISIHSLRVEGDNFRFVCRSVDVSISIHSLRVEGDLGCCDLTLQCGISIHSLRVEGDAHGTTSSQSVTDFNPLPPCGGRPDLRWCPIRRKHFNPLPPCGGRRYRLSLIGSSP